MESYIIILILGCFIHGTIAKYQNDTCPPYSQITWSNNGEIALIPNVYSVNECFKLCVDDVDPNVECVGHTWYGYDNTAGQKIKKSPGKKKNS